MTMYSKQVEKYIESREEIADYNMQAWVPIRQVASVLRHTGHRSISSLMKDILENVFKQVEPIPDVLSAISWMESKGFSVKQLQKGRGNKRLSMALQVDALRGERGKMEDDEIKQAVLDYMQKQKDMQEDDKPDLSMQNSEFDALLRDKSVAPISDKKL